jgi:23S rRNA (guanosine2251-2'-O)-methyltransferase
MPATAATRRARVPATSPKRRPRRKRRAAARGADPTRITLEGIQAIREALRARRRPLHRLRLRAGARHAAHAGLRALALAAGIPVLAEPEPAGADSGGNDQGARLDVGPLPEVPLERLAAAGRTPRTLVALDGVEDPQNVGAIARICEASGAVGLLLTRRHAPPLAAAASRASAGALEWLPVARIPNLSRALNELKEKGFWIIGADLEGALPLYEAPARLLQGDRVVVLGAEGRGLRPGVQRCLDHRVRIPMRGRIESLNVSAAAAVLLYELYRRDLATPP